MAIIFFSGLGGGLSVKFLLRLCRIFKEKLFVGVQKLNEPLRSNLEITHFL